MRTGSILLLCVVVLSVVAMTASPVLSADSPGEATVTVQDLPPGFVAIPAEEDGADLTVAFDTLASFRFDDRDNAYSLWGETVRLTPGEKRLAELVLDNPVSVLKLFPADPKYVPGLTSLTILGYDPLGDKSVAVSMLADSPTQAATWPEYGSAKRTDVVTFLLDDTMAMLAFSYPESHPPDFALEEIAVLLEQRVAEQIQVPEPTDSPQAPVVEATDTLPPPTPTFTPMPTVAPTATHTPKPAPTAQEWKLRKGPGAKYDQLGTVSSEEDLEVIGQDGECAWLYVKTPNGVVGWVPVTASDVRTLLDCERLPTCSLRPETGTLARYFTSTGRGKLRADNGTDRDGIVIVADPSGNAQLVAYLRAGVTFTMAGIPDGAHRIYIATGDCWDARSNSFASNQTATEFYEPLSFKTTRDRYTVWDITLHSVEGGEGVVREVPAEELPAFE